MTSCYLEIVSVDEPFEIDVDENGRTIYSMNFEIAAVWPNDGLEEDLIKICQSAGVSLSLAANAFIGSAAKMPPVDGPIALFVSQSGIGPLETHNGDKIQRPGAQVLVRGKPSTVARAMAFEIFRALDGVRNREVA